MTDFFTLDEINTLVVQGHSYGSSIGIKIIDDVTYSGSSILEGHFYEFQELLEVVELFKDLETTDDCLQELVLRLYSIVNNECIYYNGLFVDIDTPGFTINIIGGGGTTVNQGKIPFDTSVNPTQLLNYNTVYKRLYGNNPILQIYTFDGTTFNRDEGTGEQITYSTPSDFTTDIVSIFWDYPLPTTGYISITGIPA